MKPGGIAIAAACAHSGISSQNGDCSAILRLRLATSPPYLIEFLEANAKAKHIVIDEIQKLPALLARRGLGALMDVPSDCIQFVGRTTEALNLVVLSFPLRRGDKVVMAQDEFPSIVQAWLGWPANGVEVIQVPSTHEAQRTEALCAAVQRGVCALTVSHVHWRTGTRVDIAQLIARCREFDCRLIVDGVQAVGAVPVRAGFADAYCASVFKRLLSGFGLGFVAVSETLASHPTVARRGLHQVDRSGGGSAEARLHDADFRAGEDGAVV